MSQLEIKIKRLSDKASIPSRAHYDDAGLDLSASDEYIIEPCETGIISTGLSMAIPKGYYGRISPRSGLAMRYGIDVYAGVIDSCYRGPVNIILYNSSKKPFQIKIGDRVAQLILEKIGLPKVVEVDDLDSTERGLSGFGSSGFGPNLLDSYSCPSIIRSETNNELEISDCPILTNIFS